MRYLKYAALLGILLFAAGNANAQVRVGVGIGVGPVGVAVGAAPACAYGYYGYYPYACAPYGYYGANYFANGVFIGAGPWYHGYYGHPYYGNRYYGRPVYAPHAVYHAPVARGYVGGNYPRQHQFPRQLRPPRRRLVPRRRSPLTLANANNRSHSSQTKKAARSRSPPFSFPTARPANPDTDPPKYSADFHVSLW